MRRWMGVSSLSVYLYHLSHVALRACVLSGVFNFHEHYKKQVVPHVVLLLDVLLKCHGLVVELVPLKTCRGATQLCEKSKTTHKQIQELSREK